MRTSSSRLPQNRSRTSTQAISVPITTLTPVTRSDWPTVSLIAAQVWGFLSVSTYPCHPSLPAVDHDGGQRDQDEQAEPDHGDPEPEGGAPGQGGTDTRPAAPDRPGVLSEDGGGQCQLPTLRPEMILVMIPVLSSKNSALAFSQPPKSLSIVYWVLTAGTGCSGRWHPARRR